MKKLLFFLALFPALVFGQVRTVINLDKSSLGSLNTLLDSVQNVIWVSVENITGVETGTFIYPYNTIQEGINKAALKTVSADNRWLVAILPGLYDEAITMTKHVDIAGIGTKADIVIYHADADVVTLADSVEVYNLTVRAGTSAEMSCFTDNGVACLVKVMDVHMESTYTGSSNWFGVNISGAGNYTFERCSYRVTTGTGDDCGFLINAVAATLRVIDGDFYMSGATGIPTSSKSHIAVIATSGATVYTEGNRFDGDWACNTFYAEDGTFYTKDVITTGGKDQVNPGTATFYVRDGFRDYTVAGDDILNFQNMGQYTTSYGDTIPESFKWDEAASRFEVSDDLYIEDNEYLMDTLFFAEDSIYIVDNGDTLKFVSDTIVINGTLLPVGTYTSNVIDFSNAALTITGSNGPTLIRAGTYAAPLTNSDVDQSGFIRLYGQTSANGSSYDRGVFVALKTTGTKNVMPVAGLAEILAQTGDGPANVHAGEFIGHLNSATAKLDTTATAATAGLVGIWAKIASEVGSVTAARSIIAPIWADNQMNGTVNGEEYALYITAGTPVDAVFGFESSAVGSGKWNQLFFFDETTYNQLPIADKSLKVLLNTTQYYIPLSTSSTKFIYDSLDVDYADVDTLVVNNLATFDNVTIDQLTVDSIDANYIDVDTVIVNNFIQPDADDGADLGSTAKRFNIAWADSVHAAWFGGSDFELGEAGSDVTIDADSVKSDGTTVLFDILHSNLVDKSAAETITGLWAFDNMSADSIQVDSLHVNGYALIDKVTISDGAISATDITVGAGTTLDVSAGTLTLANDQISGDKVEGGTINAITINTATIGTNILPDADDGANIGATATRFNLVWADSIEVARLHGLGTTEQLRLSYDATNYLTVTLLDDGHTTFTTVDPDGAEADINFTPDGNVGIKTAAPGTALEVTGTTTTTDAIITNMATASTTVLTPTATGQVDTLETVDLSTDDFTVTGDWNFNDVVADLITTDTLIANNEILPDADDGANIGATAKRFNLVWADSVHADWFGGSDFELGESGSDVTIDADSIKSDGTTVLFDILHSNLVDKSAAETVTGLWAFDNMSADSIQVDSMHVNSYALLDKATISDGTISGTDVTVGAGKTLNVSAGTLTLADNQISGDKVEGGTINAITINTLTTDNVVIDSADIDTAAIDYLALGVINSTGTIDQTISTTTAGGEQGIYTYVNHITNALTGDLNGIRGNARVDVESVAGSANGGYFQAGNFAGGFGLLNARGVYSEVVNKVPAAAAVTWTNARGYEVSMDLDQGTADHTNTITNAQMFYGVYNLPTAGSYSTVTNGYGMFIRNEAVGGTGQMLDAGFYLDDLNHSGGIKGWDYGIDFSGITSGGFGTADIKLSNGSTINNLTDTLTITETNIKLDGDIYFTGQFTSELSEGFCYISTPGEMTITTGGTYEKLYEGAMAYTSEHLTRFTHSNGRLTYTGAKTIHVLIIASVNVQSGETAQEVGIRLAKGGTTLAPSQQSVTFTATSLNRNIALNYITELATNEYIEVYGTSDADGDNFTINNLTLTVTRH